MHAECPEAAFCTAPHEIAVLVPCWDGNLGSAFPVILNAPLHPGQCNTDRRCEQRPATYQAMTGLSSRTGNLAAYPQRRRGGTISSIRAVITSDSSTSLRLCVIGWPPADGDRARQEHRLGPGEPAGQGALAASPRAPCAPTSKASTTGCRSPAAPPPSPASSQTGSHRAHSAYHSDLVVSVRSST